MKKAFRKSLLASAIVAALGVSSSTFAVFDDGVFDSSENHQGDLLFAPLYIAGGGWESKVSLVNSSMTDSVVAKLVVRSPLYSQELLDFLIYLSPTDMWVGTLRMGPDGVIRFESTDDSVLTGVSGSTPSFASVSNPARYTLSTPIADDTSVYGYLEIIESAAWDAGSLVSGTKSTTPVPKADVFKEYNTISSVDAVCVVSGDVCTVNTLSGKIEISNAASGTVFSTELDAFEDYDNFVALNTGAETLFGESTPHSYHDLEIAMAKQDVVIPYRDAAGTIAIFTFPTKLTDRNTIGDTNDPRNPNAYDPFFYDYLYPGKSSPDFGIQNVLYTMYDLSENTITPDSPVTSPAPESDPAVLPYEVNFVTVCCAAGSIVGGFNPDGANQEGWMNVNFPDDRFYTGAPVLASYVQFEVDGSTLTMNWLKAAYEDSVSITAP